MPTLTELATHYHTDKAFFYAPFYELLLKGRNILSILELGVGSLETMKDSIWRGGWMSYPVGASLHMWRKYFPEATVLSMDHNRDLNPDFWFEQSDPATYPKDLGFFDLIIDDASHDRGDQLLARRLLIPHLTPGGLYITEDIAQAELWPYPTITFANSYGKATISIYGY